MDQAEDGPKDGTSTPIEEAASMTKAAPTRK